jgi:ABC-type amino acid transport substrate-binding protein
MGILFFLFTGLSQALDVDHPLLSEPTANPLKTVKTIIVDDYYPYTFVNGEGKPDGFSVDIAKAVAEVMDLKLEISVDTWENAKKALENGTIDLLPMMASSLERHKTFDFSVPHTIAFDALFVRNGTQRIASLKDLSGK